MAGGVLISKQAYAPDLPQIFLIGTQREAGKKGLHCSRDRNISGFKSRNYHMEGLSQNRWRLVGVCWYKVVCQNMTERKWWNENQFRQNLQESSILEINKFKFDSATLTKNTICSKKEIILLCYRWLGCFKEVSWLGLNLELWV